MPPDPSDIGAAVQPPGGLLVSSEKVSITSDSFHRHFGSVDNFGRPAHLQDTKLSRTRVRIATDTPKPAPATTLDRRLPTLAGVTDRPDVPDSAVVLALSRVEFGVDSVLDA